MSRSAIGLSPALYDYLLSVSLREPPLLARLREETAGLAEADMQIAPDQGAFMALLVELMGVERALEIGVFTGYSTLAVARAMPASGRVTACDVSKEWTDIAKRYWDEAGVAHKIDLRLAPAADTLDDLLAAGLAASYDFAFIDADKSGYELYYERTLQLLRPGGLVLVDNVLWEGQVIDPQDLAADTQAIRRFNEKLREDERVSLAVLPVADGLTLARKR